MKSKHEYRILFLREFTKELILNSKIPTLTPSIQEIEKPKERITGKELMQIAAKRKPKSLIKPKVQQIQTQEEKLQPSTLITEPLNIQLPSPIPQPTQPQQQIPQPSSPETPEDVWKKINLLIKDPRVSAVECPGPNKFLLVKIGGRIKLTKTTLTETGIKQVIETFSQKAKIPIIGGVFKAAADNLVITAVISDFVGSRFIISKITSLYMQRKPT